MVKQHAIARVWSVLSIAALAASSSAGVRYVDRAATGGSDGTSWLDAYTSLRVAVDAAQPGDEIWVAQGTYLPGPTATAADTFRLQSGVALYGGFAGGETQLSQRDWTLHETILSGDVGQDDVFGPGAWYQGWNMNTGNSAHVVTAVGVNGTAVLDGFTVAQGAIGPNGTPAGAPEMYGGGLYCASASPLVRNCTFRRNLCAWAHGAGIYAQDSAPTIEHCRFIENFAAQGNGAGIYATGTAVPTVRDCAFTGNRATGGNSGGQGEGCALVFRQTPAATVERCTFTSNESVQFYAGGGIFPTYGGAIMAFLTPITIRDCTFTQNSADLGGAVSLWASATIVDCAFLGNTALGGAGAAIDHISYVPDDVRIVNCSIGGNRAGESVVENHAAHAIRVENCVLWGNTSTDPALSTRRAQLQGPADLRSTCLQGLYENVAGEETPTPAQTPGCFDTNPLLVDLPGGNLRLAAGSPGIDAGNLALLPQGIATDLDGRIRIVRGLPGPGPAIVDIGAYEHGSALPGPCPFVVRSPENTSAAPGATVSLYVAATGDAPLTYQWWKGGVPLADDGHFGGTHSSALTIANVSTADAGPYEVLVSNTCSFIASATATVQVAFPPTTQRICFGDGSGTACPCGNESLPGDDAGCLNSIGNGGVLDPGGVASVSNDTFLLDAQDMPNSSALFFQGSARIQGGAGSVFGDGLRCAGGSIVRLATKLNASGQSQYPEGPDPAISVRGACTAGSVRVYQVWYRNASSFCTPSTFNLTNAVEVAWGT